MSSRVAAIGPGPELERLLREAKQTGQRCNDQVHCSCTAAPDAAAAAPCRQAAAHRFACPLPFIFAWFFHASSLRIAKHARACRSNCWRRSTGLHSRGSPRRRPSSVAGLRRLEHNLRRLGQRGAERLIVVCRVADQQLCLTPSATPFWQRPHPLTSSGTQLAEQRKGSSTASAMSSGAMAPWPAKEWWIHQVQESGESAAAAA